MASHKRHRSFVAATHALTYAIPFLFITWSVWTLITISVTHFFIDRFGLAKYVVWFKNIPFNIELGKEINYLNVKPITSTGYPDNVPSWLAVWLTIIVDNIIHIIINGLAIYYL
jgi:hypothetical protein